MTKPSNLFVTQLEPHLHEKLRCDLEEKGLEFSRPAHTLFSAKKKGLTCTLYESGKLVVQGKDAAEFVEFYLEPELLGAFHLSNPTANLDFTPRIGVDEAGKGDFFGPLCVAAFYAAEKDIPELIKMGVKDSKGMTDAAVERLAKQLKQRFSHYVVKINPKRYNEMYANFRNLNKMLAWGHATCMINLAEKTKCHKVIVDQFAAEWVVEAAIKKSHLDLEVTQRTKAEEDPVVAAASIIARAEFLWGLRTLSKQAEMILPKGASQQVIEAGKKLVEKHGQQAVPIYAKTHFKTLDAILGNSTE